MKQFLVRKFGTKKGLEIYQKTLLKYNELLSQTITETCKRKQDFKKFMLPRIALYQTLLDNDFSQNETEDILYDYMIETGSNPIQKKSGTMDEIPSAYEFFRFRFILSFRKAIMEYNHKEE